MAVYVDNMSDTKMGQYGQMKMSHMIADTRQELFEMADKIGVARKWLQNINTPREHFDISLSKKSAAIQNGAVAITMRELAKITRARRLEGQSGLDKYLGQQN